MSNSLTSFTDTRIAIAVRVQSKVVSKNTSHIPKIPAVVLLLCLIFEWARADVPIPASFESIPLAKPSFTAIIKAPPDIARGENADFIINIHVGKKFDKLSKITAKQDNM